MAAMWPQSLVPWTDANGNPCVGAVATFYDAGTTTPQTVYTDAALSIPAGVSMRTANASGRFRPLFLSPNPGIYRVRITAANGTLIEEADGVDVPQAASYVPPEAGETSPELLFATGMLQIYYGSTPPAGWVRANGRSIGSATSGATERANADCEDLFKHLWAQDSNLAVSGGRGANAASDWSANKAISLPDFRGRVPVGIDTMGSSAANVLSGIDAIGETTGTETVTLTIGQLPPHPHAAGTLLMPNHGHPTRVCTSGDIVKSTGGMLLRDIGSSNYPAYTGTPDDTAGHQVGGSGTASITGSTANAGSGEAHPNVQPSMGVAIIVKL